MILLISTSLVFSQILDSYAVTRSEGNYNIDITMTPDPVNDGQDAEFCVKVTLLNGDDGSGDFRELKIMIGDDTPDPPLNYDADAECFKGTYTINKHAGFKSGDKIPVTVYYFPVEVEPGHSQPPDGEWGVHNSEADHNQKKWKLTYKNPFYFETEGPPITDNNIYLIVGLIILAIAVGVAIYLKKR